MRKKPSQHQSTQKPVAIIWIIASMQVGCQQELLASIK